MLNELIKRLLRRFDRKLVYVPRNTVWGSDLWEDLRTILDTKYPLCLDVGANIGQTIDNMLAAFEQPTIHAFEPSPSSFEKLGKYRRNRHVNLWNVGIGARAEELLFNEYPSSDLSSFLPIAENAANRFSGAKPQKTLSREVITLDAFLNDHSIATVDLLKSDTQGFDLNVLRGAAEAIQRRSIRTVLVEMNFIQLYDGQASATDLLEYLMATGYGLIDIYEKERHFNQVQWCNALFSLKPQSIE